MFVPSKFQIVWKHTHLPVVALQGLFQALEEVQYYHYHHRSENQDQLNHPEI